MRYLLGSRENANTFLSLVRPKCALGLVEKAMSEAIVRRVVRNLFVLSVRPEMRLGRGRESSDSRGRQGLRNLFLPPDRRECDFGDVEKAMCGGIERLYELIFYILSGLHATSSRSRKL